MKESLESCCKRPVSFSLKTKRGHKKEYFDYLDVLNNNADIELVNHQTNLYYLTSGCHLGIAYTSEAYIAEALNIPCVYYDPVNSICDHNFGEKEAEIYLANDVDKLTAVAVGLLKNYV